jgi:hypothetical protein
VPQEYHNVILFGAGASADAGIPLLGSFVDKMWEFAFRGKVGDKPISESDRKVLVEANQIREDLERYNSRASFDIRNLEDILSLLSFEALSGEAEASRYDTMVRAVARTIELSCTVSYVRDSPSQPFEHGLYTNFWHALLSSRLRDASVALRTFNYDLVLERSLWAYFHHYDHVTNKPEVSSCALRYHFGMCDFAIKGGIPHSYAGTKGRRSQFSNAENAEVDLPYLKLHGSLNWDRRWPAKRDIENGENLHPPTLPTMVVDEPLILPPVFNKMNSAGVNGVWKTALNILRQAKNVIIVGYSLPKTDIYMQYFIKSAVGPNSNLQQIIVFDPVLFGEGIKCDEMKQRYLECFSPQFSGRISFHPAIESGKSGGTFRHFVQRLHSGPKSLLFYP